jgi:mono/diheme cytochrome c family protein
MPASSRPGSPDSAATILSALLAVAIALVVLDALVDHRPAQGGSGQQHAGGRTRAHHDHGGSAAVADDHGAHRHATVPAAYARMHAPPGLWTDATVLARGEAIYRQHCVVCHGERGDGRGPGAATLTSKPADMTDRAGVAEMTDSYWFWRVSEGGRVEPFVSRGSAMPAWKDVLPPADRWAVIVYQHTLSGHRGPHVPAQHPEMRAARSH